MVAEALSSVRRQFENGTVHDDDFLALALINEHIRPLLTVVDAGANAGQSIVSTRVLLGSGVVIHSFEANPALWPLLEEIAASVGGQVHIHRTGLGSEEGELVFRIPVANGIEYLEEATFNLEQFDKPWVNNKYAERGGLGLLRELRLQVRTGDSFGLAPDLLKIDVEGFEYEVLRGFAETIRIARPVMLVENSDWHRVTNYLAAHNYAAYRWLAGKLVPFRGECTNAFYFPNELAERLAAIHFKSQFF